MEYLNYYQQKPVEQNRILYNMHGLCQICENDRLYTISVQTSNGEKQVCQYCLDSFFNKMYREKTKKDIYWKSE